MKGNSDELIGIRNKNGGKWKRVGRKNQEVRGTSSESNKENELRIGSKRGLITTERDMVEGNQAVKRFYGNSL